MPNASVFKNPEESMAMECEAIDKGFLSVEKRASNMAEVSSLEA
jgi:hypothetical protein